MRSLPAEEWPEPLAAAGGGALAFSAASLLWAALGSAVVALSALALAAALERWRPLGRLRRKGPRGELAVAVPCLVAGWAGYLAGSLLPIPGRTLALAVGTAAFAWRARRIPAIAADGGA
ncbi:MAG TPA: hypothetical protein VGV89_10900 [Thermoplasmata archaeon]|nr:hypothetical protein [Thermoplasmata archaeon]